MRAGDLKHRLTIEIPQHSVNSIGEEVTTWVAWKTVWAAIIPDTGNLQYSARQLNAEADGKIRIRYRFGVQPTMRVTCQGHIYQILSIVNPLQGQDDMILLYKEFLD